MSVPKYEKRVEQQIAQYANKEALVKLPDIYRYWSQKYLRPKIEDVFGVSTNIDIYATAYIEAGRRAGAAHIPILSIGSGDGVVEVAVAERMLKLGCTNFTIVASDLSPIRMERARQLVHEKGLDKHFEFEVVDVNTWKPERRFLGFMAQHTLHHVVELERLFQFINDNMDDNGVFVVVDMIGRNGHMRWPETLAIVERFWQILPDKYKYNHQWKKPIPQYLNWDCSVSGFEGIRAEDILPLLCQHFAFTHFLGVGGFVDVFVERGYGHNFSRENPVDVAYIDLMAEMNDALIVDGKVKPTMIFAVCRKGGSKVEEKTYRGLTTRGAIRPTS